MEFRVRFVLVDGFLSFGREHGIQILISGFGNSIKKSDKELR